MNKHFDYLIVGQGLAGTLLHYFLTRAKKSALIIDISSEFSASAISSGLINPVTGRKYVRSWMYDEFFEFAKQTYHSIEKLLDVKIYDDHRILRVLSSPKEENLWHTKFAYESHQKYLVEDASLDGYETIMKGIEYFGEVQQAAKVDAKLLLKSYKNYLIENGMLYSDQMDFDQLRLLKNGVKYKSIDADHLIFCEGWKMKRNPYFSDLTLEPAKGEFLLVRISGENFRKSIKKKIFITPYKEDIYWVGSTYEWDFVDALPTQEKKAFLESALADMLDCEYEILEHGAGVRPSTLDRRPFLGTHPEHKQLSILNGLGTKGASIGPYFANMLCEFLTQGEEIMSEAHISRVDKYRSLE